MFVLLAGLCAAQPPGPPPAVPTEVIPNTPEGLQRQLQGLVQIHLKGELAGVERAMQQFFLPAPEEWLAQHLGKERAAKLAPNYGYYVTIFQYRLLEQVGRFARYGKLDLRVEPKVLENLERPEVQEAMRAGVQTFLLQVTGSKAKESAVWLESFVYVEGAFRNVGEGRAFWDPVRLILGGGGVKPARLVQQARPYYPPLAKQSRIQGVVRLECLIDTAGIVRSIQVLSGHPVLATEAIKAVQQWRYEPAFVNGKPGEILTTIDVTFTLSN